MFKKEFGDEALAEDRDDDEDKGEIKVVISKSYGTEEASWSVAVNHRAVLKHLSARFNLTSADAEPIKRCDDTQSAAKQLEAVTERTEAQSAMLATISEYRDFNATSKAVDILNERTPKFLYFSHYDRMSGAISINQLDTVPFSERSAGFIWFFSFLVKFAQIEGDRDDVIILLDEPEMGDLSLRWNRQSPALRTSVLWQPHEYSGSDRL